MPSLPDLPEGDTAPSIPLPDTAGEIILPAHCGTAAAEDILARLVIASDQEQDITINAAAVESVGQAVMQLLVAAHIDAKRVGQHFAIEAPSPAFLERIRACQLAGALELPEDAPVEDGEHNANLEDVSQ